MVGLTLNLFVPTYRIINCIIMKTNPIVLAAEKDYFISLNYPDNGLI